MEYSLQKLIIELGDSTQSARKQMAEEAWCRDDSVLSGYQTRRASAGRGLFGDATIYGLLVERRGRDHKAFPLSPALAPSLSVIPSACESRYFEGRASHWPSSLPVAISSETPPHGHGYVSWTRARQVHRRLNRYDDRNFLIDKRGKQSFKI